MQLIANMILPILISVLAADTKEPTSAGKPNRPLEIKLPKATLKYAAQQLTRRGTASELRVLRQFTATLQTNEKLAYRRRILEPGKYNVQVEATKDGKFALLIRPANAKEPADKRGGSKKSPRSKRSAKTPVKRDTKTDAKGKPKTANDNETTRVPLFLTTVKNGDKKVVVDLRPVAKATRLRLTIRAGTTLARAALRRVEIPATSKSNSKRAKKPKGKPASAK